ncbi:MAG: Fic family protein [Pseudomonadota bacterium]|nr:Fic family protein [Pseudomonadota bacterium]
MSTDGQPDRRSAQRGWDEHNLSQLRYFRSLSLRGKLQAVEGMADVVRHLQQIRAQGGFKPASRQADEPGATHPSRNPQVADPLLKVDNPFHGLETSRGAVAQAARNRAAAHPSGSDPPQGRSQHGLRGGTSEPEDAGSRAQSSHANIRFVETTLGIQSYAELAPHLALRVQDLEADIADGRFSDRALGEDLILEFHQRVCGDLVPDMAGRWRHVDVRVGDHEAPPYPQVPMLMRNYCRDLEARIAALTETPDDRTLEYLAFAEGRLLWIHPFEDFNGRLTRVFLAELLQRLDMPALDPTPDPGPDTERYLRALQAGDRADWGPLAAIWHGRFEKEAEA